MSATSDHSFWFHRQDINTLRERIDQLEQDVANLRAAISDDPAEPEQDD